MKRIGVAAIILAGAATAFAFISILSTKDKQPFQFSEYGTTTTAATFTTSANELGKELWSENLEEALERARTSGKPVLVDFFATWCPPCKMLEKNTFSDAGVQAELSKYEAVRIDVDRQPDVASKYGIRSLPTLMCLTPDGQTKNQQLGYIPPDKLLAMLKECGK